MCLCLILSKVHCVCIGFLIWLQLLVNALYLNGWSSVSPHCILEESINHTHNIKVKTHETEIFVTACFIVKGFKLFSKMLTTWKQLGRV